MNTSATITEISSAMAQAFADIEGAVKDKTNPHFRSKYADLGNVVDAVKPALLKHGLWFSQVSYDIENHAAIETVIYHKSGEWISCGIVSVPVSKIDAQGYGSAMTYARRYSLSAAFGVAPEDDDGNLAVKAVPAPKPVARAGDKSVHLDAIRNSPDLESLKVAYTDAVRAMRSDKDAVVELAEAKDARKKQLESESANA